MERHQAREHNLDRARQEIASRSPLLWRSMIDEWSQPGAEDRAWLMYSANYLFRTHNVRWAMDPVRLEYRLAGAPPVEYAEDLRRLSFVVLTHRHGDHLDTGLVRSLKGLPITWVVPEAMIQVVTDEGGLPGRKIVIAKPLQPIEIEGIRILPFEGMHWEQTRDVMAGKPRGVPAMAYLMEFSGKRWLFPGDTRTYDASLLPALGPVDGLFAHVWLGHGTAADAQPPLLDAFCHFCLDLHPTRVVLTHLQEFGRAADDYWDTGHAMRISSRFRELSPSLQVTSCLMGQSASL